ncbi:DegT/DnrJ/EryC1/StrS family aminotransferase [[Flexibacter] sp. ATCC 35208]|uniref:DegT/DnrJ/EryC1/StrS family aminotransferase n=1 Tax=[Flexibacter] sp. ATCC 35208 TaxID=1936242 RepID=UPI0009D270BC|nr:DegT/DnrJ/EryC1/StrS family aminotransferase [[Flexibacter] sp. ATCC 35208]OMP77915.1 hypothetical protein BW716_17725 [[Flexibacter] sp. ATCC 35208]
MIEQYIETDKEIGRLVTQLVEKEELLNTHVLHLTANENRLSKTAREVLSSALSFRYHLGIPADYNFDDIVAKPNLLFRGLPNLYRLEDMAHRCLNKHLGGVVSDSRPLSGLHAMICSISSLTSPGDIVLSICPEGGGHFATATLINQLGRKSVLIDYDRKTLALSLSHLHQLSKEYNVKAVFLDDSAPLYAMPLKEIRDILGPDVIVIYDASHTLGLIYGQQFLHPLQDGCDVIQANTHKTFPGPQKGLLHFADNTIAGKAMQTIGSCLVSSQHTHHSLAFYITALEMDLHAKNYADMIVANAKLLSGALEKNGFQVLTNGKSFTDTHQILFNLPGHLSHYEISRKLLECHISTNAKHVYERDVVRIGVQELTRLGMRGTEMEEIAGIIKLAVLDDKKEIAVGMVNELNNAFQDVHYSFDNASML